MTDDGDAIMQAKASLAARLMQWRLPEAHSKAGAFIDDLIRAGWKPHPKGLRRPPMKSEECCVHPGEYSDFCRACVADRKAAAYEAEHGPRLTPDEARAMAREAVHTAATTNPPPPAHVRVGRTNEGQDDE